MKLYITLTLSTLLTLSLSLSTDTIGSLPCGNKIAACPSDSVCTPISATCTDLDVCPGKCEFVNTYTACDGLGGHDITPCDEGAECVDDPRAFGKGCDFLCVVPKICIAEDQPVCAGFAGFSCPEGLYCYDVPGDGCDTDNGGADCLGICL